MGGQGRERNQKLIGGEEAKDPLKLACTTKKLRAGEIRGGGEGWQGTEGKGGQLFAL